MYTYWGDRSFGLVSPAFNYSMIANVNQLLTWTPPAIPLASYLDEWSDLYKHNGD